MSDEWVKSKLERIEEKIDTLHDRLNNIDKTLVQHEATLQEHTRRSLLNEENLELLRKEFKPVENHVAQVHAIFKFIGVIATIISMIAGIIKIISFGQS